MARWDDCRSPVLEARARCRIRIGRAIARWRRPIDELLPLSAYHRQSDEMVGRLAHQGGIVVSLFVGVAAFLTRFDGMGLGAGPMSVLAALGGYLVWVGVWGGSMKRLHRGRIARVYEEEARICPEPPPGDYRFRLPMCADISSARRAIGGTLFVASDHCAFVPNSDQRGAHSVFIPFEGASIQVREWVDAPRATRGLAHRHRQLDLVSADGTHSFIAVGAEHVAEQLRLLLPSGDGRAGRLEPGQVSSPGSRRPGEHGA